MYFRVNSPAVPYIVLLYTGRPTAIYIYLPYIVVLLLWNHTIYDTIAVRS